MIFFLRSDVEVDVDAAAVSVHSCPYAIELTGHEFCFRGQFMEIVALSHFLSLMSLQALLSNHSNLPVARQQVPLEDVTDLELQTD